MHWRLSGVMGVKQDQRRREKEIKKPSLSSLQREALTHNSFYDLLPFAFALPEDILAFRRRLQKHWETNRRGVR